MRKVGFLGWLVIALGVGMSGCGRSPQQLPRFRIVREGRPFQFGQLSIGQGSVFISPHGELVVPGPATEKLIGLGPRLLYYGTDGELVDSFGGQRSDSLGVEPVADGGWFGDTLWLFDGDLGVTTVTPARPRVGRESTIREVLTFPGGHDSIMHTGYVGLLRDGGSIRSFTAKASQRPPRWAPPDLAPGDILYFHASALGVLDHFLGRSHWERCSGLLWRTCLGPTSAISTDGNQLILARVVRQTEKWATVRIEAIGATGDTLLSILHDVARVPITRRFLDSVQQVDDSVRKVLAARDSLANVRRTEGATPATFRAFTGVLAGRDGSLWLQVPVSDAEEEWHLFDGKGRAVGRVTFPHGARLCAADLQHAWTIQIRDDTIPELVRYRLYRPWSQ